MNINAALVGTGAKAVLCPNAVFTLAAPITFTAPSQEVSTQGYPTDRTRAVLLVSGSNQTSAVNGVGQSGAVLRNVQVDGNRPALGSLKGDALIVMGGAGTDQTVRDTVVREPRSWSALHFIEGAVTNKVPQCQRASIVDNQIGPAGQEDGTWADGISLACGSSLVQGNTVTDATDGAIVVFGAPGSTIQNNTIVAMSRQLLGGINMVDFAPVGGNYTGTVVKNNVIDGKGHFIKVGIAMGPAVWNCATDTNYGATVTGNTLQGMNIGYGYAVNGVTNWIVTGNVDRARHVGAPGLGCNGLQSAPTGFQFQSVAGAELQPEFQYAQLQHVLRISEAPILRVPVASPTGCGVIRHDEGLYPGQSLSSCDGRFTLTLQTDGNLVLTQTGNPIWATATDGRDSVVAIMQKDGNFVVYSSAGEPIWSTGTNPNGSTLAVQNDGNTVVYTAGGQPLWSTNTAGR
ncbi:right-handed parallel beta-helix repeat-containing protein [Nocardia altamirensis]|uniref:right-handed parallel beta-helix repeat-containing protein n=1 Tax=Nocardia altamirensis TaxID=472158 RepID=UPI0014355E64|nr:right-handed parallel beta-helix repeat-containing protein [Nocardia altamirensis]